MQVLVQVQIGGPPRSTSSCNGDQCGGAPLFGVVGAVELSRDKLSGVYPERCGVQRPAANRLTLSPGIGANLTMTNK